MNKPNALADADMLDEVDSEDQAAARQAADEERQAKLDAFASALEKKRLAAVQARQQSGIEQIWRQDEEFYEGIDDANRAEEGTNTTVKPRDFAGTGGAIVTDTQGASTSSTVFLNITRAYVDFSAGRAADMLLPTDEPNWDLKETPMPDIIKRMGDTTPLTPPPGVTLQDGAPATMGEAATQMVQEAKDQVGKAKTRIEDWLEEGQYHAEQRKVLRDAAKVGVGILKGPFPVKKMARAFTRGEDGAMGLQLQNKLAPVSKCISYWNFYPDASCGENIHNGNYTWERDRISARQLRDLLDTTDTDGKPLYIESVIKQCLAEGPQRAHQEDQTYQAPDNATYDIWYYHGVAEADDLRAAGVDADEDTVMPVIITTVNGRVIKAALSTLDSGEFPYDVMVWQEREGHWTGIGVARQVRTPQRMINAGNRNMLDNAGLGAGPQIIRSDGVKPVAANDDYTIRPRKQWKLAKDSGIEDVNKAFAAVTIPMVTEELMTIIQFALKMAEDVTGMPMLLQGQQGQATDTVGGMTILTNNSNTPLRAIAKLFDDRITVPHLLRYYEWLLLYGPEESEKGEYVVAARGSSALFEKDAQNQAIMAMAPIVENPAYKINPEKWFREALRAQRLAPDRFQYSDTEWAAVQQKMQQAGPPADPRIEAAKIAADSAEKREQIKADVAKERIQKDTDRDTVYVQAEQARDANDHTARMEELALKRELALLDYANQRQLKLEDVKKELANTSMKLQVQKQLSAADAALDLHKHHTPPPVITPPTEPAGRADNGRAFQA